MSDKTKKCKKNKFDIFYQVIMMSLFGLLVTFIGINIFQNGVIINLPNNPLDIWNKNSGFWTFVLSIASFLLAFITLLFLIKQFKLNRETLNSTYLPVIHPANTQDKQYATFDLTTNKINSIAIHTYPDNSEEILPTRVKIVNKGEPAFTLEFKYPKINKKYYSQWIKECVEDSRIKFDAPKGIWIHPLYDKEISEKTKSSFNYFDNELFLSIPLDYLSYYCFLLKTNDTNSKDPEKIHDYFRRHVEEFYFSISVRYKSRTGTNYKKEIPMGFYVLSEKDIAVKEDILSLGFYIQPRKYQE